MPRLQYESMRASVKSVGHNMSWQGMFGTFVPRVCSVPSGHAEVGSDVFELRATEVGSKSHASRISEELYGEQCVDKSACHEWCAVGP